MAKRKTPSRLLVLALGLILTGCQSVGEETSNLGYAAATPLRDLNLLNRPVPGQLRALQDPYGYGGAETCHAFYGEATALNAAIIENSRRFVGYRRDNNRPGGRFGNTRDAVVGAASTLFIPFRGVIRQLSGAAAREQRAIVADQRARLRLGYLVGQARAYRCPGF